MLRLLLALSLSLSAAPLLADSLEEITGATQQEREIRWLWKYLGDFVRGCSRAKECSAPEINKVIGELATYLPAQIPDGTTPWAKQLQFVSETDHPEIFQSAKLEIHRIAITERTRGATVYVNTLRMGIPLSEWVGLLTHETIHHLGYDDDTTRLPDRVGAAVAAFVQAHWVETTMAEFGHPEVKLAAFNNSIPLQPARALISIVNKTMDTSVGPNERVPLCSPQETFQGQTVATPLWRVAHMQAAKGAVSVHGSGTVLSSCRDNASGAPRTSSASLVMTVDLIFAPPINLSDAWWSKPSKINPFTLTSGVLDGPGENWDTHRTFFVKSVTPASASLKAGGIWQTRVVVESIDGFAPTSCEGYMSAANWSYHRGGNLPALEVFDSCALTALGPSQWQLDLKHALPANAQPDFMYIPLIRFPDAKADRYAMPLKPADVIRLDNPAAAVPLKATAYRILGLQPMPTLTGVPLVNSFRSARQAPFWLEVDVKGDQTIGDEFLDMDLISPFNGDLFLRPYDTRVDLMPDVVLKTEHLAIPGGTRLRYQLQIPLAVGPLEVHGFKLDRIYVKTGDFSWMELEIPLNQAFVMDATLQ